MQPDDLATEIVVDLLASQTGQTISQDRRWRIAPALSGLFRQRGIADMQDLIVQLTRSDDETLARLVVEALLNNETYFFRDRAVFDHIRDTVLPQLAIARAATRRLRVWSVGCSTGQEALSLAMFFAEQRLRWDSWQIDILATDVSRSVIDFARGATYSNFQIQRGLGVSQMLGFFTETAGGWQASDSLSGKVRFNVHNVLNPAPEAEPFDLILCRNVLLYFDEATRQRALSRLSDALAGDGRLVLGGGEMVMEKGDAFELSGDCHSVFRRKPAPTAAIHAAA